MDDLGPDERRPVSTSRTEEFILERESDPEGSYMQLIRLGFTRAEAWNFLNQRWILAQLYDLESAIEELKELL